MKPILALFVAILACGDSASPVVDAGPQLPAWEKGRESAAIAIGSQRGFTPVRGIIHLHSPLSHDACDGKGLDEETGAPNEDCLADLRAALCTMRIDYAALTDHDDFMADQEFSETYLQRADDELILNQAGEAIASRIHCDDGHEVMWTVGSENSLMPIMIDRHPAGTIEERKVVYNSNDAATAAAFRDLGGLTFLAHTEDKDIELLRTLGLDGLEIYNLHANLAPDIREDYLGLDGPAAIRAVLSFAGVEAGPEPDLAILAFLEPSNVALEKWDTLLGEGQRITGTAGTDAHQNALPTIFRDGERGDSYRRMISWFSNIALVETKGSPEALQDALEVGRSYVAFEIMGSPAGFDVRAAAASKPTIELGGEVLADEGYVLEVVVPSVYNVDTQVLDPQFEPPSVRVAIVHVNATGSRAIASGTEGTITAPLDAPGAYRVEVYITPTHLIPYLRDLGPEHAQKEHPWIYTNPIYVVPN